MLTSTSILGSIKTLRSGVIPYTIWNDELHFLFARHAATGELGDFGGGTKKYETALVAALREFKEESAQRAGQFLPIDIQPGGSIKPSKRSRNLKQPLVSQGEIEIELRTPSGAEIRIRGYMDSIMVSTIIASTGGRRNV